MSGEGPVKSDFPDKPASLKRAIKEALRPYNRQFLSELVADAVDKAIDTPLQQIDDKQIYDLPKRLLFLKHAANRRPRFPQALLHLLKPENDECYRSVICNNCKYNFLCRVHYYGKEILYLDSVDI